MGMGKKTESRRSALQNFFDLGRIKVAQQAEASIEDHRLRAVQ
jgi:hypothetical protein